MAEKKNSKPTAVKFDRSNSYDVKFSTGITRLSFFYRVKNYKMKVLVVVLLAIFLAVFLALLIENSGLYSGGTAAFFQGIARMIHCVIDKYGNLSDEVNKIIYNLLFWGLYLIFNICLYFALRRKMSRTFLDLSIIYIAVSQVVGMAFSFIPGMESVLILGNTNTVNEALNAKNVQVLIFEPNVWPSGGSESMSFDWDHLIVDSKLVPQWVQETVFNTNLSRSFLLVFYAILFAVVQAIVNSVLYIVGASSFGTEAISLYLSESKNKDVGTFIRILQMSMVFMGILLGSYLSSIIAFPEYAKYYASWTYLCSANLVCSFLCTFLYSLLVQYMFPSRKLVKAEVITTKSEGILNALKEADFTHPTTLVDSYGGYSRGKSNILFTVLPVMEIRNFIGVIRQVDDKCLISVTTLSDADGNIALQKHQRKAEDVKSISAAKQQLKKLTAEQNTLTRKKNDEIKAEKNKTNKQLNGYRLAMINKKLSYKDYLVKTKAVKTIAENNIKLIEDKYNKELTINQQNQNKIKTQLKQLQRKG